MAYIEVKNEYKRYQMGETTITANDGISFEVEKGEVAVILGPSGAGKSTVLNILGGMDSCDEGEIIIDGTDIAQFSEKQLTTYRRNDVGFVFQFYNLVPNLTAKENVELASQIVADALDSTNVLPTGALDFETGKQILTILQNTARETGTTVLIITHNSAIAEMADRVIRINDAKVREMTVNDQPKLVAEIEW